MPKQLLFDTEARAALKRGADKVADAVRITIGPKGRNVVLDKKFGSPTITNDGVTIAKEIDLEDPFENMGAQLVKEVASKTNDIAGDGTTTATVLAAAMINEGLRHVAHGANPVQVKAGIQKAVDLVVADIKKHSVSISEREKIAQVASISAADPGIGETVADAMEKVGKDGVITVEESKGIETELDLVEGMQFDKGYISPYMVTNTQAMEAVLEDPYILITDRKISAIADLLPVVEKIHQSGKPLVVVADTANGMGGLVVPAVFSALPFKLEILFPELDGNFPNHPADPIQPENLVDLKQRVISTGADIGLAFDGDADRVFLVDDQGQSISGSTTTALVAKTLVGKCPGSKILYNLICSKAVPEIIAESGGIPIKTRVGHSFIKTLMGETDALFAGEHSGHYYFRDNFRADSGLIASMVVLEVLSLSDKPLSQLRTELERYSASGEVNTKVQNVNDVLAFIENAYQGRGKMDHMDGLTVDLGDWWFNVRPSNTEPLLRLNLEAKSDMEVASKVQEVLAVISKADSERK